MTNFATPRKPGRPPGPTRPKAEANIPLTVALWRQRQDMQQASLRLNLQAQAICRRECGEDTDAAAALWKSVIKGECDNAALMLVLHPFLSALAPLDTATANLENEVRRQAEALPLWKDWAKDVRGVGPLSLGGIIGEAARPLSDYRTVSCVWKRFGLAVIDGQRQRLVAGNAELAVKQGYSPRRRAFAFNIGNCLMRQQKAADRYRQIYDERRLFEEGRVESSGHAHNRAMRYITKELLKDAWLASRA